MPVSNSPTRAEPIVAPIFPIAMAIAWIVEAFVGSGDPLPHLVRPLLVTLAFATVITVAAWVAGRRRPLPLLIVGVSLLLFLKAWPLLGAMLAVVLWRGALALLRRRNGQAQLQMPAAEHVVRLANTFSVILLVVVLGSLLVSGALAVPPTVAARGTPAASAPNLYFVLLDGYPRQDSLIALGIDNGPFVAELAKRGFSIAPRSRTNYHNTLLTLDSMLNGRFLADLPELADPAGDLAGEERQLNLALNRARLLDDLRSRGYEIVTSPSPYGAAELFTADMLMAHGTITHFDQRIIGRTFAGDLLSIVSPGLVDGWHRDAVLAPIRDVESVAADQSGGPRFILTHVLSPHPPFLFDANGDVPPVQACYADGCSFWTTAQEVLGIPRSEYVELLRGQLQFLDERLLQMVDRLVADDPDAVVVLFGDHGIRFDAGVSLEYFRNFFAARTPGHSDLFPEDISPVNVLPLIENAYLGTRLPTFPYEAWESKGGLLLNLDRWRPDPT